MNAESVLTAVARVLADVKLSAVLIGNAAAALHGAPVTTIDLDFMFRKTPANLKRIKQVAIQLDALVLRPYYPASGLYRVVNDDRGIQIDFMFALHGIKSFASLRARAEPVNFGGKTMFVARLEDIIASKRAAGRARDIAVLGILEKTLHEKEKFRT